MPVIERIGHFHADMKHWRHDIHAHPEMAFKEHRTSDLIARTLEKFGVEVHRGLAGTGVVGTLRAGSSARAIGLRADMDALPIREKGDRAHASIHDGIMHACGHDGHTTMLLGAARYLAETRNFDGVVHFIFQPAEENECGGQKMVNDGLFDRFPVEAVYGMHNWPGIPVGSFGVCAGPIMAADDKFEIVISSRGAHAAMPHLGDDPIVAAASMIGAIQTIVSRTANPEEKVVVSITQIHGGNTWNIVPEEVVLRGTCRYFDPGLRKVLEDAIARVSTGVAAAHGVQTTFSYYKPIPPAVNAERPTAAATRAAAMVVGEANVRRNVVPSMGTEDFAFMLAARPGCYIWIGNGPIVDGVGLHSARYDFNDAILPLGASYWSKLVESVLAPREARAPYP
ncbi:M20 aminoacylase family protein [Pendulispora albinea]|uniref:M20 family metallopeptidase n=1 Tax=Pendulispora albinea TaxID=2741071 RepID=A0ABZ2LS04_9BACT